MAETFLHLDRLGNVDENTVFELSFSNAHPAGPTHKLDGHGIYEDVGRDDYDFIEQYFEGGLTAHGKNYLYNVFNLSEEALKNPQQFLEPDTIFRLVDDPTVGNSWVKEIVFELVRRDSYPERPSRFQSVFGARNEEELRQWRTLPAVDADSGDLYRVTPEGHFIGDSSLLDLPEEYPNPFSLSEDLKHRANQYWSGNTTKEPVWEVLLEPAVEIDEFVKSLP